MTISCQEMEAHIRAGRARRWPHVVGPARTMLDAAKLGDQWFVALHGRAGYHPVTDLLGILLTRADNHYSQSASTRA